MGTFETPPVSTALSSIAFCHAAGVVVTQDGSVVGCGVLMFLYEGRRVTPISPIGFLVGTGGALILLFFYKLLGGKIIKEGEHNDRIIIPAPHVGRGSKQIVIKD